VAQDILANVMGDILLNFELSANTKAFLHRD